MVVNPSRSADHWSSLFRNWPLTRGFGGGSKQTRTADPLLVRQRQTVRHDSRWYVCPCHSAFAPSANLAEPRGTTLHGYTLGYIPRPTKGDTKIN